MDGSLDDKRAHWGGDEASRTSALLLDLYELTMAQAYVDEGMDAPATFSLFVRSLPPERGYLVAAGLEDVLQYIEQFAFGSGDLSYLESTGLFMPRLLDRLARLQFTGSVRALPEGTVCFADEPLLEVTAPIVEAQLLETIVINEIQLHTMIASKAARCVSVGGGKPMIDFSLRRVQGPHTGLPVARASYLAGFEGTSNVLAGQRFGIPIAGTMAHSYIEAFDDETAAFRAYALAYPDTSVLLLDTYDVIDAAHRAVTVGRELAARGHRLRGVRLDSGDLVELSRAVRAILDDAGLTQTIIFASGALDEYAVEAVVKSGAPIDGFGVGTRLGVSADAPHLDLAYKLVAYDGRPTLKLSAGKSTWPAPKQVWRTRGDKSLERDWLGLSDERAPDGAQPLLVDVMRDGQRAAPAESLEESRARCREQVALLPAGCLRLREPDPYPVHITPGLRTLQRQTTERVTSRAAGAPSLTRE
jgi:nicotinate phosphoribosyltransferase